MCVTCEARVDQQLGDILDLHALAGHDAALTPAQGEPGGHMGARRDPPPPVAIDALDLALGEHYLGVLEDWERFWRDAFRMTPYGTVSAAHLSHGRPAVGATVTSRTLVGVVGRLRRLWPYAARQLEPPPDEFATEVRRLHRTAIVALRLNEPAPWSVPCPADLGDRECGYPLRVDHDGKALSLRCPRCRSVWTMDRLLLVAAAAGRGVWVTIAEAAEQFGVTPATVRRMIQRGELARRYDRVDLTRRVLA